MSEKQNEKEAVRTTIVGGRPPGSGRNTSLVVPRGIEVLVKKAAVDPEFRELLLARRGRAAASIELELDRAEAAMLNSISKEQLSQVISHTNVPMEQRRVFLGWIAAAMLAVIGAGVPGCKPKTRGVQPDRPGTEGIRPDRPETAPTNAPADTPPDTNQPTPPPTRGVQSDRP